jgi:hypothetical protein
MTNLELLQKQLRGKAVTLDCNILLLLFIGYLGVDHIGKFKRTMSFIDEDYSALMDLIQHSKVFLTPNILTEASNLIESYNSASNNQALLTLKGIIDDLDELHYSSVNLANFEIFLKFGLADASIFNLSKLGIVPITVDFELYGYIYSMGYPVINFNHVRSEYIL